MINNNIRQSQLINMQTTKTFNRNSARSSYLPNISTPNTMSYAQRYEHMTKLANYNQMNQGQIWKQYQKLRMCLKQLNEQVLYHMQKKAQTNLYAKQTPVSASVEVTLTLLEEEKRTNQSRHNIYLNEASTLENRVDNLINKKNYLEQINYEIDLAQTKIKQMTLQNKDLKRRQKMVSKDLVQGGSFLDKLIAEEQALHFANRKKQKYELILKQAVNKIRQFSQKKNELQRTIQTRLNQFKKQQDYISQQINLQKYEELQNQKTQLAKYQSVYKRNYLMKLKELQNLVNSVNKHDQLIQQVEGNNLNMRSEIDSISAMVVSNSNRRRSSMSMAQPLTSRRASKSGRRSILIDNSVELKQNQIGGSANNIGNDKNQ